MNLVFGMKETTLEKKLIERLRNEYLDIVDIRVSFGENTSKTYLKATNNKLEDIDVVIIDITAKEYGKEYCKYTLLCSSIKQIVKNIPITSA